MAVAKKKKAKNYVNNADLMDEIHKSKETQDNNEDYTPAQCLTPKLVKMLMMLVERYSQKANWRNYTYLEDMKGEALVSLCQNALKFNPEKSNNPFGYYTQIVTHSFLTFLDKEKRVRKIRDDLLEQNGFNPSFSRQIENDERNREAREERWNEAHAEHDDEYTDHT